MKLLLKIILFLFIFIFFLLGKYTPSKNQNSINTIKFEKVTDKHDFPPVFKNVPAIY